MKSPVLRRFFLSFVLCLVWQPNEIFACPNCKEAVSAQPAEVQGMADGFNWSILLMLSVPFSMLCTGMFVVKRASRLGILPEL